jgi:PEGA domain
MVFAFFGVSVLLVMPTLIGAQQSQIMGELRFSGNKAVKDSGVWIDRQYVGYVNELKGDNKILLLPGGHEIVVRQAGYKDYTKNIVVEPRKVQTIAVTMEKDSLAVYPAGSDAAELKLNIAPARAAVFVDDGYIGHAGDFGGYHVMVVSAGKHRVRVELPGYRTFETEVNPQPGQRTEIKTGLLKGGVEQAGALIKE